MLQTPLFVVQVSVPFYCLGVFFAFPILHSMDTTVPFKELSIRDLEIWLKMGEKARTMS